MTALAYHEPTNAVLTKPATGPSGPATVGAGLWRVPGPSPLVAVAPDAILARPPLDILREMAMRQPDADALVDARERFSFADLMHVCHGIARHLDRVVPTGGTVAVVLSHSAPGVAALLGCLASGRLCFALNASDPPERRAALLAQARADVVFTENDAQDARRDAAPVMPTPPHDADRPAMVLFTSGSSGRPKGIVLSARSLLYRAHTMLASSALSASDALAITASPTTSGCLSLVLASLSSGATCIVANPRRDGARGVLALAGARHATAFVGNARILRVLCDQASARAAFERLRLIRAGAIGMTWDELALVRRTAPAGCVVNHAYASTEAVVVAEWNVPPDLAGDPARGGFAIPVGHLRPELEYALVDAEGREARPGEPGMMCIRSPYVALGEWRDGALVQGRMHPDPNRPGWRAFTTGDILRLEPGGLASFSGRADRQINRNGVRVEPGEVEAVLRRDARVTEAVVLAVGDAALAELHAFVAAPSVGAATLKPVLQTTLREALPASHRPTSITILDVLPTLPGGKVDVTALRKRAADASRTDTARDA